MTSQDKEAIKMEVLAEIESTQKIITDMEKDIKPIAHDVSLGRLTRMEAINSQKINEATLRDAKKRLNLLYHAIKKIEQGKYGICCECGKEIPIARLRFMPETSLCVECCQ